MKRLDINVTDRLNEILMQLQIVTGRSKTELVHDAVALLSWAQKANAQGYTIGTIDSDGKVIVQLNSPLLQPVRPQQSE